MKKLFPLFALLSILTSCGDDDVTPSGRITQEVRSASGFNSVEVGSGFNLQLEIGTNESVIVETYENLHKHVVLEDNDGHLLFREENGVNIPGNEVLIIIKATSLDRLIGSGGSDMNVSNTIEASNFQLSLTGGSECSAEIQCSDLGIVLSGGSDLNLAGSSSTLNIDASGGSVFGDFDFSTDDFDCLASGGSKIDLTVNSTLRVEASGGSVINYNGSGVVVESELSSGSELNKVD